MLEVKSFPIFYPTDGLYYIFSKGFGHFWRERGEESGGGTIGCEPLRHVKEGSTLNNRIWKVTTAGSSTEKLRPRVTLQSARTLQGSKSTKATGFVSKKSGRVIQSSRKMPWMLIGHGTKPFSYKIVTGDLHVSINAPIQSCTRSPM